MHCCAIWCIGSASSASLRRDETGDAFAGVGGCWFETGDTFARGNCGLFGRSGLAAVMAVSLVSSARRAVVMAVSLVISGRRAVVMAVPSASWAAVAAVVAVSCGQRERCRKWLDGFNPAKLLCRVSEKMRHAPLFQ